jgi:hypothetical protein
MEKPACSIEDCAERAIARTWCYRHYERWRKYGDPLGGPRFRARRGSQVGARCSVGDCEDPVVARGWCQKHWQRWRKYGDPLMVKQDQLHGVSPEERFWPFVDKTTDGHWLWTRPPNGSGYGTITVNGRTVSVHRFAYELVVGPVPEGHEPDHRCGVRLCCNPDPAHIKIVTRRENRGRRFRR